MFALTEDYINLLRKLINLTIWLNILMNYNIILLFIYYI